MKRVNVAEAKARFSEYVREAKAGEKVVICKRNVPIVETKAVGTEPRRRRVLGRYDGLVEYDDSALTPMSDEEVAEFEDAATNPTNLR